MTAYSFPPTRVPVTQVRPGDILPLLGGGVVDAILVTSSFAHFAFTEKVRNPFTRRMSDGVKFHKTDSVWVSRRIT